MTNAQILALAIFAGVVMVLALLMQPPSIKLDGRPGRRRDNTRPSTPLQTLLLFLSGGAIGSRDGGNDSDGGSGSGDGGDGGGGK